MIDRIRSSEPVERWMAGTKLPSDSPEWVEGRLQVLSDFLDEIEKSPEEIVAYCFLRKRDSGERFVSAKRRAEVNGWIDNHAEAQGWVGKEKVSNSNIVRSFLIHNGVPIGSRTWTGG